MKKTLILFAVIIISFPGFSQKSISDDVFGIIKAFNSVTIGKKVDIDNDILNKHIRNMSGFQEITQLIKDYESDGKWLSDGLVISDELKPFINVKGETIIFTSKGIAELGNLKTDLHVKAIINKTESGQTLDISYYIDYIVFNTEGKQLLSIKMTE